MKSDIARFDPPYLLFVGNLKSDPAGRARFYGVYYDVDEMYEAARDLNFETKHCVVIAYPEGLKIFLLEDENG